MIFWHILPALLLILTLQVILQYRLIPECLGNNELSKNAKIFWVVILLLSLPGIIAYLLAFQKRARAETTHDLRPQLNRNIEESIFLGLLLAFLLYVIAIVRVNPGNLPIASILTACLVIMLGIHYLPHERFHVLRGVLPYLLAILIIGQDYLSVSEDYGFVVLLTVALVIIEYSLRYNSIYFWVPLILYQAVALFKFKAAQGYLDGNFIAGYILSNTVTYCFVTATFYFAKRQLIQNNQLHYLMRELKGKTLQLEEAGILKERSRIAREIHDTLGHSLTGAIIQLEVARKLIDKNSDKALEAIIRSQEITRSGFNDVKRAIKALNPLGIEELSLSECLHQLIQEARDSYNFNIEGDIELPDDLSDDLKIPVYRIIQELITNSIRHGQANNMELAMECHDGILRIQSHDNGKGCSKLKEGNGLRGIRERIDQLDGQVRFSSEESKGFAVLIHIPL
ncbi:sensor histidine kinase [uncultured Sphaerochaeta sp.]|uniref:sensor histidine kinase n=1 Tax=uncultured Sphaerochaeta sp. TaxID=886478 RepID=UPI0029C9BB64|nr:sensor histidine kinase [uncultured Sphaerochaeta sp.]